MFGGPIGATDGRYAYYLYPEDLYAPGLHEYTLMPMHLHSLFIGAEMKTAQLAGPFDFTKDMPLLRIDALKDARRIPMHDDKQFDPGVGTTLYDLSPTPSSCALSRRRDRAHTSGRHRADSGGARRAARDLCALRARLARRDSAGRAESVSGIA